MEAFSPRLDHRGRYAGGAILTDSDPDRQFMKEVVSSLDSKSYQTACDNIDSLVAQGFPVAHSPEAVLDLKRFAARMVFVAANDFGAPIEFLRDRYEARCALGYARPQDALAVITEYAMTCIELHETKSAELAICDAKSLLGLLDNNMETSIYLRMIESSERAME